MYARKFQKLNIIFFLGLLVSHCTPKDSEEANGLSGSTDIQTTSTNNRVEPRKKQLKFKSSKILRNSYSKILALDKNGMCLELGSIPCTDVVHNASLMGMDAYTASQYTPAETQGVTAPIAVERVAMSACVQRVGLDFLAPSSGVIFKNLEVSGDGRLVKTEAIKQSIERLYTRSMQRLPTGEEVSHLENMYEDIYQAEPIAAGRNWAVLSCFAVMTSVEFLFY